MLNLEPTMAINHTSIEQWCIRPAVAFWAKAYGAGVRILWDGKQFQYQQASHWYRRLETHGAFGLFPAAVPVTPEPWVTDGVEQHDAGLIVFLSQPFPDPYRRFAAHTLVLDYEVKPIEAHARRAGHLVIGTGVNGGQVLMYHGKCDPTKHSYAPTLPPILSHYRSITL
jgi:hypothetical protein